MIRARQKSTGPGRKGLQLRLWYKARPQAEETLLRQSGALVSKNKNASSTDAEEQKSAFKSPLMGSSYPVMCHSRQNHM